MTGGGKGGGSAKKPELTYGQANLRDYQAYKSGEIDRDEYLRRERTRNPYSNPESPYAGDFSAPSYELFIGTIAAVSREIATVLAPVASGKFTGSSFC